jgi:hypothetical protein
MQWFALIALVATAVILVVASRITTKTLSKSSIGRAAIRLGNHLSALNQWQPPALVITAAHIAQAIITQTVEVASSALASTVNPGIATTASPTGIIAGEEHDKKLG